MGGYGNFDISDLETPKAKILEHKKQKVSIKKWEHLPKRKKWWERRKLKLRSIGISNKCFDKKGGKYYSIQFYDLDTEGLSHVQIKAKVNAILEIFPYDLILYKTKHGIHFISFALLKGYRAPKARAVEMSKTLGDQDYWTTGTNLVLRVSPKWRVYKYSKLRYIVSEKPKFLHFYKKPNSYIISNGHLEFYHKFMGLPDWVYYHYSQCDKRDYQISITHYKTRD